jgi:hypothetical protein
MAWSPPGSEVRMTPLSGSVQAGPIPARPFRAPTTPPTVAAAESVSQPAITANPTLLVKSPAPRCKAKAMVAALLRTWTQCK